MKTRSGQFPWKTFIRQVTAIAVPVALQNLLTTTASMVDTMMVAPLGELSVGAIGLCAQFSTLMFSGYWGFLGGGMLFFAQYFGAKDDDGIERSYGMTITCVMTVASLFACMALFAPELVMMIYTDKESVRQIGIQYLRIVGFAYVMQVLSMGMSSLLRTTERVTIPLIASICSVAANLTLNWIFIYGHLGAPAMGIRGAALATTIAAAVNVAVIYILAWRSGYRYLFHVRNHFRWNSAALKEYFIKCFPILCNEVLIGIGNMVINITLGRQPEQVIAAVAVFRTLEGLVIGFFAGFSNAASVLIGTCVGGGEPEIAYERARRLVYLCSGTIFLVDIVLLLLHTPVLTAMSLHGESFTAGTNLLIIYAAVSVIRMGNWIHNDMYRASGETVFGTVLEITFMLLMVVPCVLISAFVLRWPYWTTFICCYIDEPIRYFLMQRHLYSTRWIKPITDIGKEALEKFRIGRGLDPAKLDNGRFFP